MAQNINENSDEKDKVSKSALRILWGQLRGKDRHFHDRDKVRFLKKIPFFETLKKTQLEKLALFIYERDYRTDEFVFELGQPGAALFIIQSGEIAVEIPSKNNVTLLATLGKGAFLGELALLDESPRSASARATVNTHVFALFRKDLDRLSELHPDISSQIYKALAGIVGARLKATNELVEKKIKAAA
jgi:CRP/FNR family cyclic AMP-dependent transcriptional regulator